MDKNSSIFNSEKDDKDNHCSFPFYKNYSKSSTTDEKQHDFLGMPTMITLGSYSKSGYDFSKTLSVVNFELTSNDSNFNENTFYSYENNKINLPQEVLNLLFKIPSTIPGNGEKKNQNKVTYSPLKDIKFKWIILDNNTKVKNGIYNIVPHIFYFKEILFDKSNRMVNFSPISVCIPKENKSSSGVKQAIGMDNNKKFSTDVSFNELRVEYSSVHTIKQSLAFSPNNLKLVLDNDCSICSFWLVVLDNNSLNHYVYNYWVVNDETLSSLIESTLKQSSNVSELIKTNLLSILGKDNQNLMEIMKVFDI